MSSGCGGCCGGSNYTVCCTSSPKCCKMPMCCPPTQCCYPTTCCMPLQTCCYTMNNSGGCCGGSSGGCCGN